jgi:hypothetical protein
MENRINLYAIALVSHHWDDEPFDPSKLPALVVPTIAIENVESMFSDTAFELFESGRSKQEMGALRNVKYALVHRFQVGPYHDEATQKLESGATIRSLAACLRLIRPMRQFATMIHGTLTSDGTLRVNGFDHPSHLMNIPLVQQGFSLRNRDVVELQSVASKFLAAMAGEYWKFRIPLSLHDAAHFMDEFWKARMSILCSGIEAIYTSQTPDREHAGGKVAKARIKWFLGEQTCIYASGDIPSFSLDRPAPTIGDVLDGLYEVRNCLAHGDKIPDKYFVNSNSSHLTTNTLPVLEEAASFIVRRSLTKMLKNDLLEHFKGGPESRAYFASHRLTRSQLPKN